MNTRKINGKIYKYINNINGKVYIGQTTQTLDRRDSKHITTSLSNSNKNTDKDSYFHRALRKYGRSNFSLILLEENIENSELLDEREKFWININDSFFKSNKGYNMTKGGKWGNPNQKLSMSSIPEIIKLLKESDLTFSDISKIFNVSKGCISDINLGRSFLDNNLKYPIRNTCKRTKISNDTLKKLINDIINTKIPFNKLSEKYNIPLYTIEIINRGEHKKYSPELVSFPLRKSENKMTHNNKISSCQITDILKDIILSEDNFDKIGRKYGIKKNTISDISRGISWKKYTSEFKFPLRKNKEFNEKILKEVYGIV